MIRMRTVMRTITVASSAFPMLPNGILEMYIYERKEMMTTSVMIKDDDDHHDDDEKAMQSPKPPGDCFRVGPLHQYHLKQDTKKTCACLSLHFLVLSFFFFPSPSPPLTGDDDYHDDDQGDDDDHKDDAMKAIIAALSALPMVPHNT